MNSFWSSLNKPIQVLAPMADVTDAAFRRLIAKYSRPAGPDVFYTEFVSVDGLFLRSQQSSRPISLTVDEPDYHRLLSIATEHGIAPDNPLLLDLLYTEAERPIVAQLFTAEPELMHRGAKLIRALGFDGLDINMGCPDRSVEKQGCGAALIKTPELAQELIRSAQAGAGDLPVSVKTRVGYRRDQELETWLPAILSTEPTAVILHARTRQEMSKVPANWQRVQKAVAIRDQLNSQTLIIGNGDIQTPAEGRERGSEAGADGVMIGRGIFGQPWLWREQTPSLSERLRIMVEHTALFEKLFGDHKNFSIMKKHYKAYVSGWDGAKELRSQLMEAENANEVGELTQAYLKTISTTELN